MRWIAASFVFLFVIAAGFVSLVVVAAWSGGNEDQAPEAQTAPERPPAQTCSHSQTPSLGGKAVVYAPIKPIRFPHSRATPFEEWANYRGKIYRDDRLHPLPYSYPTRVADPELTHSIGKAAERSGAHVVDVTVYDFGHGTPPAPYVRLQSAEVARYMLYGLRDFLCDFTEHRIRLVELFDEKGHWAWFWLFSNPVEGGSSFGGSGSATPELGACSPFQHRYARTPLSRCPAS